VNRLVYLLIFIPFICSCQNIKSSDDDLIIDSFIHKEGQEVDLLHSQNDNSYVINLISQLKEAEQSDKKYIVDSLKLVLNIVRPGQAKDSDFDNLFSLNEYDYLIAQEHRGNWSKKVLLTNQSRIIAAKPKKIFFSKPIYSRDGKWALAYKNQVTSSFIVVFKKEEDIWVEYKTINNLLVSPKIPLISTKN
jgi:hypothetical protein